ncbi:tyrosine-type recombinase/integrase [Camelimonas abortus]|uniref:Tyrosine-type recombinase/integrase n=1 Tax=Camelimonas abortus TaxID=1017184 RepID=A0ABV7LH40_9HYPH
MPDYSIGRLNGRYVVSWWIDGKRKRYRLKALNAKDAEREALDTIRRDAGNPDTGTIADIWDAYRAEKEGRRVAEAMRHEWKAIGPFFGHLRPEQVTTAKCRDYTAARRKAGKHDGTIWTELGHLRTALVWALGRDKAPRIDRPAKPAPKERYLTTAEIARLLDAPMAHHIRLSILLMLSTAGRVGAVLELTWDRVDMERGQINLRTDATGPRKGRAIVPMNAGLRAALEHARSGALTDHVIEWAGRPVKSIKTGFNAAVAAAGLENVTPHVLRHTAAVHLAAAGVPMARISQYLGHSSTAVTERVYARFSPDHLRDEAEILDFTSIKRIA